MSPSNSSTVIIAPLGHETILEEEMQLKNISFQNLGESTYFIPELRTGQQLFWSAQQWHQVKTLAITSIGDAIKKIKSLFPKQPAGIKRTFYFHPTQNVRRMMLIAEAFPTKRNLAPINFGQFNDQSESGRFIYVTMLDPNTLLISDQATPHTPGGIFSFSEDKVHPPSRAYLKLWEFFTRYRLPMNASCDVAIDLGSAPGGWTWVIAHYAKEVISVDKAALADQIYLDQSIGKITPLQQSAYALNPKDFKQVSWIFCDIISYPEKTIEMIERWVKELREVGQQPSFVCTLKFQGKTDFEAIEKAALFPGSHIVHLHHNKHELTWYFLQNPC